MDDFHWGLSNVHTFSQTNNNYQTCKSTLGTLRTNNGNTSRQTYIHIMCKTICTYFYTRYCMYNLTKPKYVQNTL